MSSSRRDFLRTAGGFAAVASAVGAPAFLSAQAYAQTPAATDAQHTLPDLPYDYDALEPFIDEETMRLHHDKHHAGYVKGLIGAEASLEKARQANDFALVQHYSRQAAFHGGGHFLHSMFWKNMAPNGAGGGGEPSDALAELLSRDFGSVDAFRAHFSAAAKAVEGSGWGLLHYRFMDGKLVVRQAENQHKLSSWDSMPVLGIDVWEHAYYVKYRNDRGAYVDNWWNVVNWANVEKNIAVCAKLTEAIAQVHAG